MKRQTIAVDIDDVLATSVESWITYSNKKWGTNLTVDDYDEDWTRIWQVDHEEGKRRQLHIYEVGLVKTYKKFRNAEDVLVKLSKDYDLVIATSRPIQVHQFTLDWIDEHFKGIFKEIHLARIWDSNHEHPVKMTKRELCESIDADYLIDDHPKHCFDVADAGIKAVLFGDYGWSRHYKKLPKNVHRAHNWEEVARYFHV